MPAVITLTSAGRRLVQSRHPWVYHQHVAGGQATPGAIVRVVGGDGHPLGYAAWSPASRIALRFLCFGPSAPEPGRESFRAAFEGAVARRRTILERTDAARLFSSEADGLPGLIVDRYGPAVTVQALTPFAEHLLPEVREWLVALPGVESIVARNDAAVRELEGLPREVKLLHGPEPGLVEVQEDGIRLLADLAGGQKTGLFLDQRQNRAAFGRRVAAGWRVLDLFCHAGGFGFHAARAGADVLAVDDSAAAVEIARRGAGANGYARYQAERANAFPFLRAAVAEGRRFDAIVLDPPAFAKSRREREAALRGYGEINLRALRLLEPGGLLVTASCSYHVDEVTFEEVVRRAAADAGRDAVVLARGEQDLDHPVLLSLPQSRYLKCLFLEVR